MKRYFLALTLLASLPFAASAPDAKGGLSPQHLQGGPDAAKQIHIVSSGLKAGATWHRVKILQDCRECCGGERY